MEEDGNNLEKLKYATEWQVEIGKVLQSFDPVLRPLEDMAKHGITLSTLLLGISALIVGAFISEKAEISYSHFFILGAWGSLVVATVAGSIQLHRIAKFRENIREFCHVLLGKEATESLRQSAINMMKTPQKNALIVEYWGLSLGVALLFIWATVQMLLKLQSNA